MQIRTWVVEAFFVAAVLSLTTIMTGGYLKEWIGSLAVLFSFMQAQVADRLSEKEANRSSPEVHCYQWSNRYFVMKEVCWISYFFLSHTYAALCGSIVFLLYPLWRKIYRTRHPLNHA